MKLISKLFALFFIIFLGIAFVYRKTNIVNPSNLISLQSTPTQPPTTTAVQTLEWNGRKYAYVYFIVNTTERIDLIPNFSEKKTSNDIAEKYACMSGINGGFYDTTSAPLGGFMTDGKTWKKPVRNRLIDGYLWSTGKKHSITLSESPSDSEWYLQTGPLLMLDGKSTTISIGNDEYRRRSLAGITKEKQLLFLTIYNPESVYEGPLLADLPQIISLLSKNNSFNLTDAINLDGGSASAFISKEKTLQEFSPIGSFFCVK